MIPHEEEQHRELFQVKKSCAVCSLHRWNVSIQELTIMLRSLLSGEKQACSPSRISSSNELPALQPSFRRSFICFKYLIPGLQAFRLCGTWVTTWIHLGSTRNFCVPSLTEPLQFLLICSQGADNKPRLNASLLLCNFWSLLLTQMVPLLCGSSVDSCLIVGLASWRPGPGTLATHLLCPDLVGSYMLLL